MSFHVPHIRHVIPCDYGRQQGIKETYHGTRSDRKSDQEVDEGR